MKRSVLVGILILALSFAASFLTSAQVVVIGLSGVPTLWTRSLSQPRAIIHTSVDVYRVDFKIYDIDGTTLLWQQKEFRTKLGPVNAKVTDARWCLGGKKDTGFNFANVRSLTQTSRCNDFDTVMLADTSGSDSYKLVVTAYKTDGGVVNYTKRFLVRNEARLAADSEVEWVAPGGSCTIKATCTKAVPYGSIQEAVNDSNGLTTIIVQAGTYRQSVSIPSGKDGTKLIGRVGKTFVDGTDQFSTAWTLSSGSIYSANGAYTSKGYASAGLTGHYGSPTSGGSGNCRDLTNKPCASNDLIFAVNNSTGATTWLRNHAYNASPGSVQAVPSIASGYFWIGNVNKLYVNVGANPSGYTFYYANRQSLLTIDSSNVTVRGLTVRRATKDAGGTNAGQQFAPTNVNGGSNLLEFNDFAENRWAGIWVGSSGNVIRSNKIRDNLSIGYTGSPDNAVWQSNEIYQNNNVYGTRHEWRAGFESGGGKTSGGTTAHNAWIYNYAHSNGGPGIWPDTGNEDTLIYRNRAYDNAWNGIDHELNVTADSWALIQENVAYENGHDYSWAGEEPVGGEAGGQYDPPEWNNGSNILVRTSDRVEAKYNLSAWGFDGGIAGAWESSRVSSACPDFNYFNQNVNIQHRHNIGDANQYLMSYVGEGPGVCGESQFEATSSLGAFAKVRSSGERIWFESASTFSGGSTAGPSNYVLSFGKGGGGETCFFLAAGVTGNVNTFFSSQCSFGNGTVQITSTERDTWLRDHGIPLAAASRPTSGPY